MPARAAPVLGLVLLLPALAAGQGSEDDPAQRALSWLAEHRGEWPYVTNVVEAAAQAGHDPKRWPTPEADAFSQLAPYDGVDGEYYSHLRVAHAAATSGYDPRDVNGVDYLAKVRAGFTGAQSGSATFVNDDAWAILALRAAGVPEDDEQVRASARALRAAQLPDGSWSYRVPSLRGSTDMTGMALAALRAAGEDMRDFAGARDYLETQRDFGFRDGMGGGAGCQSTVWGLHGYAALGEPEPEGALDFLLDLQAEDGGVRITGDTAPNAFCTAEAIVVFAGARYPLPGFSPAIVDAPDAHASEPVRINVRAPFTSLDVSWDDGGAGAARTFDAVGDQRFRYHASGQGITARGEGHVTILSARPLLGALPENLTLFRHAPLALDLSGARDPDGAIARIVVDWGDGNLTDADARRFEHAYALPGDHTLVVRALDDAGVESLPARILVRVENRAPLAPALPERLVADRVTGVALDLAPADPEGDAVDVAWTFGALSGVGAPVFLPTTLGNHTLALALRDAFGATTNASLPVQVVNLPPEITTFTTNVSGAWATLAAEAVDPDGGEPLVVWDVGGARVSSWTARVRLAPGETVVRAIATDADGATSERSTTLHVEPAGEPARVAPEIHALDARFEGQDLVVEFIAASGARATLAWTSDAGDGERVVESPARIPLPGATQASARLTVELDDLATTRGTGILLAPMPPPGSQATGNETQETVVVAAARPESTPQAPTRPQPSAPSPQPDPLESASLTPQPREETPAPAWIALAAVALLAMRGRRVR